MKKTLFTAAVLILLTVKITVFYFTEQAEIRDASENTIITDRFKSLQQIDRAVETELLLLHAGQVKNYDGLTFLLAKHRQEMTNLSQITDTNFKENYPQITTYINDYKISQKKILPLIDLYKSNTALTKNALNYISHLASETWSHLPPSKNNIQREELGLFMPDLIQLLSNDSPQSREIFNRRFEVLKSRLNNGNHPQKERLIKIYQHISIIFTSKGVTLSSLKTALSSSHTHMLEKILEQYLTQQQAAVKKHQQHSYAAVLLLLLLSLAIMYSIYRLIMGDIKLRADKASLTTEVLESREFLQQSNEELKREIEQRKQAEEELQDSAILYQHCNEGVVICDKDKKTISVNPAFTKITGITAEQLIGKTPRIFDVTDLPQHIHDELIIGLETNGEWRGEVDTRNVDGRSPKEVSVIALRKQGQAYRYIVILTDISERKKQQETIHFQANYDPLTNLPNRNLFNERARQTLASAKRSCNKFATLFIDLDNFKKINDNLGHHIGDELLIQLASRLSSIAREVDTVSRFGGDEFIIILDNVQCKNDLKVVIQKLIEGISKPVDTSAEVLHPSASIGISVYPDDGSNMGTLIRCADMAMYKAKQQGKNRYCFFEEKMDAEIHAYHRMENQLRNAITNDELSLVYQPIIDTHTQTIYATEALVRWQSNGQLIPPDKFIPVAEESGLIVDIGEWIFRKACQQLTDWNDRVNSDLKMSINVSTLQFKDARFAESVNRIIAETAVDRRNINIEITESLFLEDSDSHVFKVMKELRAQGVSISLDDFGTGYSSMSYLKHFPVNVLKIDRSFVNDVTHDPSDQSLIKAIINLAEGLNIKVVAEGVETEEQYQLLSEYSCDYIQGYYFSRPKSAKELQPLLNPSNKSIITAQTNLRETI